jgi:hypothetical protein
MRHRIPSDLRGVWFIAMAVLLFVLTPARAASWKGLEPFVSKRADVERVLGRPSKLLKDGALQFSTPDGTITVFFVTPKFIAAKRLPERLAETILEITIQRVASATDTPESLGLLKNSSFKRSDDKAVAVFTNTKDGITHTFINGRLKTTRYFYSEEQLSQLQKTN